LYSDPRCGRWGIIGTHAHEVNDMRTLSLSVVLGLIVAAQSPPARKTIVSIEGGDFQLNGRPTYSGRAFDGMPVHGLLFNSRMVQGIFDDRNPETRARWNYPDGPWDADRNTREFVDAMPLWRAKGLLAFTINLQGGSPEGYSRSQPWINSAFETDGTMRPDYMSRLERILDRADALGMVAIVGFFYQGQERRMNDEQAIVRAADAAVGWLIDKRFTNVLIEVANEADNAGFIHDIIKPAGRALELIDRVKRRSAGKVASPAGRLLVSTSLNGGAVPSDALVKAVDFVLLHGNGVRDPARITQMVEETRKLPSYRGQPVVFNEDDHFDFGKPENNLLAALRAHASWGYFDYRMAGERYDDGYQSVPVNWTISSQRKREFFETVERVTGGSARTY
jgi:hypothetical protein